MPRQQTSLSSAIGRVADAAAVIPGIVLQGMFGAVGLVRPAPKPLHPSGRLRPARIRRFGLTGADRVGVPFIDEPGETYGLARLSRATGLPTALPDIHGLAIRVDGPTTHDDRADILMATTGLGAVSRFVLRPSLGPAGVTYSTLLPYRTDGGPLLLAAIPDPRDPARMFLACASLRGAWRVFADLTITESEVGATGDASISFDPVVHQLVGLDYYSWATRLREGSYRAARRTRGDAS
ncbi:MAG: hypothetical protein ABWY50_06370 [Aeromicrobium sp.]